MATVHWLVGKASVAQQLGMTSVPVPVDRAAAAGGMVRVLPDEHQLLSVDTQTLLDRMMVVVDGSGIHFLQTLEMVLTVLRLYSSFCKLFQIASGGWKDDSYTEFI